MAKRQFASTPIDVGHGFFVEFTFAKGAVICEWVPDVPGPDVFPLVVDKYRLARDIFVMARLHRFIGDTGIAGVKTELRDRRAFDVPEKPSFDDAVQVADFVGFSVASGGTQGEKRDG